MFHIILINKKNCFITSNSLNPFLFISAFTLSIFNGFIYSSCNIYSLKGNTLCKHCIVVFKKQVFPRFNNPFLPVKFLSIVKSFTYFLFIFFYIHLNLLLKIICLNKKQKQKTKTKIN